MAAAITVPVRRGQGFELPIAVVQVSGLGIELPTGATGATAAFSKPTNTAGVAAGNATYRASGVGYAGYVTPTDMIAITGSATKTVAIVNFGLQIQSTAAALQTLYFIKRSAANTGGTATNPTAFALDSTNAAATAVVNLYSAAPAGLGAAVGTVLPLQFSSSTLTTAGAQTSLGTATSLLDLRQPVILRGVAESLALNYNGAALTAGFAATWFVEWIEY
jgi:hypothetical protein